MSTFLLPIASSHLTLGLDQTPKRKLCEVPCRLRVVVLGLGVLPGDQRADIIVLSGDAQAAPRTQRKTQTHWGANGRPSRYCEAKEPMTRKE